MFEDVPVPMTEKEIQLIALRYYATGSGRRCSRYQFECRSSGECIAIYNACDGIPQCTDGSDEAPELDCPSPASTPSAAVALPPTARPAAAEAPLPQPQLQQPLVPVQSQQRPAPVSAPGVGMQPQYRAPPSGWNQQQSPQQPVVPVQNLPQYPGMSESAQPAVRSGKPYGEGPGPAQVYNVPSSLQWSGFPQQQQARQPLQPQQPPQPVQQQQQQAASYHIPMGQFQGIANHEYEDQNSHIFTHKGNGLVADSDRYNSKGIHPSRYNPAGQYSELPHEYNKYGNGAGMGGYYGNVPYRQPAQNTWQLPQQQQPNQPMAHDLSNLHALEDLPRQQKLPPENPYNGPPIPPDYYYEDSQEARYHPPPAHEQELVQHAGIPHGERESITDGATPIQVKHPPPATHQHHHKNVPPPAAAAAATTTDNKHDDTTQEHKESVETHTKEQDHSTTVKPAAQKTAHEQHHTSHHRKHPQPEVSLEETGVVIEPIDGEVGKPSGAILSLSLGLCITVFMIILVACRFRLVRRRLRRGKSP